MISSGAASDGTLLELESGNATAHAKDEDVIDWDGPEDPENPINWSRGKSFGHVIMVAILSLVVNLASTMFAPGAKFVAMEFEIRSSTIVSFTISLYVLGFALGPMIISSMSEVHGRLLVYHICNVIFLAAVLGCALSQNLAQFMVFRFISGCGGGAPLSLGGGTIADVIPLEERGLAAALFGLGPLLGPVLGPVIGGFLANAKGWRWTFWLILILGGAATTATMIFMRETHPKILLERKVRKLRKATGNENLKSKLSLNRPPAKQVLIDSFVRPTKLLLFSPIVLFMSLYVAVIFGLMYLLFTTFDQVFQGQYGFNSGVLGLAYLGLGVGELVGLVIFGVLDQRILKWRLTVEKLSETRPEHRLILMIMFSPITAVGLFIYGWTAYYKVQYMVPIFGTFIVGIGTFFVIMPSQLYLVDVFGSEGAASSLAANVLMRSLFGAFLPLAGPKMYETMGYGWGNTLLGFLALLFVPAPVLFYKYGEWLRSKTRVSL